MSNELLLFEVGESVRSDDSQDTGTFALDVDDVYQVIESALISKVPLSPAYVEGIMSVGGRVVTVVDPCPLLGLASQTAQVRQVVIVRNGKMTAGNLGLKVSRIRRIVRAEEGKSVDVEKGEHMKGVVQFDEKLVHVLDVSGFAAALATRLESASSGVSSATNMYNESEGVSR